MPPESQLLSFDDIVRVTRVARSFGMNRIRLTGGEPLLRQNVVELVRRLRDEVGLDGLGMTTNATRLPAMAMRLVDAGLRSVNISLDTVNRRTAAELARADVLAEILLGIDAAMGAGLTVKLNAVIVPDVNDDAADLAALVDFTEEHRLPLRFIEYMPMGSVDVGTVTAAEIRRRLSSVGVPLTPKPRHHPADPAEPFVTDAGHEIGFIHSISDHFCDACDRMRLTAEGTLRPCLHQDAEVDLRPVLHDDDALTAAFTQAASLKWAGHRIRDFVPLTVRREMVTLGG